MRGDCGKSPAVSHLQDLFDPAVKGISFWGGAWAALGVVVRRRIYLWPSAFATITNANST